MMKEKKQENNELQLQTGPFQATFAGLIEKRVSTKDEWDQYLSIVKKIDEAKQWIIGDLLVIGKKHYGDRLYQEAARILGYDENKLRQYKSLSDRFELLLRSNNLTWNHHYEVASIKKTEIVEIGSDK
jgi:hypothetical protein